MPADVLHEGVAKHWFDRMEFVGRSERVELLHRTLRRERQAQRWGSGLFRGPWLGNLLGY